MCSTAGKKNRLGCLLIFCSPLSALLWKDRSCENSRADFHTLSESSVWSAVAAKGQQRIEFHFQALRPGHQTPAILIWTNRKDPTWPKGQERKLSAKEQSCFAEALSHVLLTTSEQIVIPGFVSNKKNSFVVYVLAQTLKYFWFRVRITSEHSRGAWLKPKELLQWIS